MCRAIVELSHKKITLPWGCDLICRNTYWPSGFSPAYSLSPGPGPGALQQWTECMSCRRPDGRHWKSDMDEGSKPECQTDGRLASAGRSRDDDHDGKTMGPTNWAFRRSAARSRRHQLGQRLKGLMGCLARNLGPTKMGSYMRSPVYLMKNIKPTLTQLG